MRRLIAFPCEGETLLGTLDEAPGGTGLLIVSGGNEIRAGAHRGMALLAGRLAAAGVPVFRYDRRGVGDSGGDNRGYAGAVPDLIAAATAFRAAVPGITRLIGFGNCDAATLLALHGRAASIDALVLANPWTVEDNDALPPAAALRVHYRQRLRDPREWVRLLRGGVDLRRLGSGLRKVLKTPSQPAALATRVIPAIASWGKDAEVVLARGDATAIAYSAAAKGIATGTTIIDTDSHSFARADDAEALFTSLLEQVLAPTTVHPERSRRTNGG